MATTKPFNPLDYGAVPVSQPPISMGGQNAEPAANPIAPKPAQAAFNPLDYGATPVSQPAAPQPDNGVKGGFLGDLLTGNTQKFGKTIGESVAAPENAQKYSDSLESHTKIQSSLVDLIKKKKALGQDTTRLQAALEHHIESTPKLEDFTGDVINKTPGQVIGEGIGTGLEALSGGILESGAKSVASKELSTLGKINQAGKIGAGYGAVASGANSMAEGGGPVDVVKNAAVGGAAGYGLGAGLGVAGVGIGKVSKLIKPNTVDEIISKRADEISNIENNYAKTRKVNQFSKDAGAASRNRVAQTDVLVNAVDHEGLVRTKQPGGAVDQYKAMTIDNAEGVVRENLVKEGAKVPLKEVEADLTRAVYKSGAEGKNLQTALNDVKKEVAGYRLKADADGNVPLELIHDAKIDTTKSINFFTPPEISSSRKAIAKGLKEIVEKKSSFNVKAVNSELAKYYKDITLLENLDGKRVKGGRLGKYFSQISGNIVGSMAGSAVGGPFGSAVGAMVGGELSARIRGNILSKMLGEATGNLAPKSAILDEAVAKAKSPRLSLPAPRDNVRIKLESGKPIRLSSKSESAIEEAQSKSLGNRNAQYANANTTNKTDPINNNIPKKGNEGKGMLGPILGVGAVGSIGAASRMKSTVSYKADQKSVKSSTVEAVTPKQEKLLLPTKETIVGKYNMSRYASGKKAIARMQKIYKEMGDISTPEKAQAEIDRVASSSPVTGKMVHDSAEKYGVDPKMILTLLRNESDMGTSKVARETNNPGNILNTDEGKKTKYPSVEEGVNAAARELKRREINK